MTKKQPVGRPTVATDDLMQQAAEYLTTWSETSESVPSIEGLAVALHVARSSLYERKEFSDILEAIRTAQAFALINGGLSNKFNSTITKLMLSKHGYVEKSEQDITTAGESIRPVENSALDTIIEQLKRDTAEQA